MSIAALKPLDQIRSWTLENTAVRMDVEQETGFIRSLLFKQKKSMYRRPWVEKRRNAWRT